MIEKIINYWSIVISKWHKFSSIAGCAPPLAGRIVKFYFSKFPNVKVLVQFLQICRMFSPALGWLLLVAKK